MAIIIHPGATLTPVGYFRFADPAGAVGVETYLLRDGPTLYQVPLTYRDAPYDDTALVATADPVWIGELLRLVATGGVSEPSGRRGVGPAEARGRKVRHVTVVITAGRPRQSCC